MIIRNQQIQVIGKISREQFKHWMFDHLNEFFPEQCLVLGESGTLEVIDYGIDLAKEYEIIAQNDVCRFIDLLFCFGDKFWEDPDYPWAFEIMEKQDLQPSERVELLYQTALDHLDEES